MSATRASCIVIAPGLALAAAEAMSRTAAPSSGHPGPRPYPTALAWNTGFALAGDTVNAAGGTMRADIAPL